MAVPGIPTNFYVQQGNGQVFLLWDITPTATSYQIQRSTDGVNFSNLATSLLNNYLDTTASLGTQYYYQVAGINLSGTGSYTASQNIIPTPTSEMSLAGLRLASQQKADRVNSNFVTLPEWNFFIDLALYELYDLLIAVSEDYFMAPAISFVTNGSQNLYPLPDGVLTFQNQAGQTITAAPFYKLMGVDLALNSGPNGFVTIPKFEFIDRNKFIYPNSNSTMYGVFNMRYRMLGTNIEFIPTPSASQKIQLWYIPRLPQLLKETDMTNIGFSGYLSYVIARAAKYALNKEESDTSAIDAELLFIKKRIEESASNRDIGRPDTISDTRGGVLWGNDNQGGWNGAIGGF